MHPHPQLERLFRLERALWCLEQTLGHRDIPSHKWRLDSHLAIGMHGLRHLVNETLKTLDKAAAAPTVHQMAADMVAAANRSADDTRGT